MKLSAINAAIRDTEHIYAVINLGPNGDKGTLEIKKNSIVRLLQEKYTGRNTKTYLKITEEGMLQYDTED